MPIRAEIHSDDFVAKADFDASAFFETATARQVSDLASCGWGGDYPADAVAYSVESNSPEVARVMAYSSGQKECGFEVSVEARDAIAWIVMHRSDLPMQIEDILRKNGSTNLEELSSDFKSFRRMWFEMGYVLEDLPPEAKLKITVEKSVMAWDLASKLERRDLSGDQTSLYQERVADIMENRDVGSSQRFSNPAAQIAYLAIAGTAQDLQAADAAYEEVSSMELAPKDVLDMQPGL